MSIQDALQVFERAVAARARLLRVEADRSGDTPRRLMLTFDVGRVLVLPTDEGLTAQHLDIDAALPNDAASEGVAEDLGEDEPWWRVLGQPLTAAWPGGIEAAEGALAAGPLLILKMRFREESENPRVVQLASAGSAIRVSLE